MTKTGLKMWCKELDIDPTDADEILWTVDEMEGMFGDENGLYQEIREYVYNNMMDGISLEENDNLVEEIKRDSNIEKYINDAIKSCNNEYNLENITVETTPQGNIHIMTLDGKDICTIDGSKFSESDIEDLRVNGYFKEETLEEYDTEELVESVDVNSIKCSHCGCDNVTLGNKMMKLEDDNLSAYTFCQCNKCRKFTKLIYKLADTIQMKPMGESKIITEGKGMMDLVDSMQNWATASTTEYNKTKNKEYLDLAGLIEKVIDKSKDIIESKNEDKVEESKKLTEGITTYNDIKTQIEDAYHSVFPNSACSVSKGALGKDTFFVTFYLAGDNSEFPNGISQNDLFHIDFYVSPDNRDVNLDIDSKLPETLTLEVNNNTILTTPDNPYMAYGSVRVPLRKVSGTPEKIVQTITKYAQKTKEVLNKLVADNKIPKDRIELVNKKLNENKVVESKQLNESKSISLYGKTGTPFALSNEINNVPLFKDDIEDSDRNGYMDIIKKYSRLNNLDVFNETQDSIIFKFKDAFDNIHFLKITDNLGDNNLGKSKKISCTNKSGTPLSLSYAGIRDENDYKKDISKADRSQYEEITKQHSRSKVSLIKQNDTKTVLQCEDRLGNIEYIYITE